jgi:hypothetical protein
MLVPPVYLPCDVTTEQREMEIEKARGKKELGYQRQSPASSLHFRED